jgi:hypothetical protein
VTVLADTPPALANVRLLPVPSADPPYDAPAPPRAASRPGHGEQQALPLLFVLANGVPSAPRAPAAEADPVFDRQPTGTHELPDVRRWVARLSLAAVEVQAGSRPLSQLRRWLGDEVYDQLLRASRRRSMRVADPRARQPDRAPRIVLRTVRTCEISDGVVEACAVVDDGRRVWALAMRLEGVDGRWRCTAMQKV